MATAKSLEIKTSLTQAEIDERKNWERRDVEIQHHGTRITLPESPEPMSLLAGADALTRKHNEMEQEMNVTEFIDGYPFDAAVAFVRAMKQIYGWATAVPTPTFFGPELPQMMTVRIGPDAGDTLQVPIGSFKVPNVENLITTGIANGPKGRPAFYISGKIRKKNQQQIMQIVELARSILVSDSIYKGRALRLNVEGHEINGAIEPEFLHTKHVKPQELIFSEEVMHHLTVSLFTPILKTAECVGMGIPLKRGILLEGKYGCGKSLTAAVTSKLCVDNGWTFVSLDRCQGLRDALEFAKRYEPAVVFAEDIDRLMEERDEDANDLLNTIDGVLSKNSQVVVVLTTNHLEKINKAMLRPGRLDAVVSVLPPDADAAERLMRLYGRGRIAENENIREAAEMIALDGNIPATIREVVERSKLAMIAEGATTISNEALKITFYGMKAHLKLLNSPDEDKRTPEHVMGDAIAKVIVNNSNGTDLSVQLNTAHTMLRNVETRLKTVQQNVEASKKMLGKLPPEDVGSVQKMLGDITEQTTEIVNHIHGRMAARARAA